MCLSERRREADYALERLRAVGLAAFDEERVARTVGEAFARVRRFASRDDLDRQSEEAWHSRNTGEGEWHG